MSYTIAGLSKSTLDEFRAGLFGLDISYRAELAEVEERQGQIDTIQEELEAHQVRADEIATQAKETATLLAERFRSHARYVLNLYPDGGEDSATPFWELYDDYLEETLATWFADEQEAAHAAHAARNASRLTSLHPLETVEHWLQASR